MKTKLRLNKLHVSDKSFKSRFKNKPFYALKWPVCDFKKQGSRLITIKTDFFIEFVRKCIYSGFLNTVLYVHDIIVRYDEPQKHFLFKKSSDNHSSFRFDGFTILKSNRIETKTGKNS